MITTKQLENLLRLACSRVADLETGNRYDVPYHLAKSILKIASKKKCPLSHRIMYAQKAVRKLQKDPLYTHVIPELEKKLNLNLDLVIL